jgi:hypothetical protein
MPDSGGRRHCLSGAIDVAGRILRDCLTHGGWELERRYRHMADVRAVIGSWAALRSQQAVPRG